MTKVVVNCLRLINETLTLHHTLNSAAENQSS